MTYLEWIADYVESIGGPDNTLGKCGAATAAMVLEFPELKRVRGHVLVPVEDGEHKEYPHWWCVAPNGDILDPTAAQFPFIIDYKEHVGPEPTGRCPDCGAYVFGHDDFCSKSCEASFRASLG